MSFVSIRFESYITSGPKVHYVYLWSLLA